MHEPNPEVSHWYREGYDAYWHGIDFYSNPYHLLIHPKTSFDEWAAGWNAAEQEEDLFDLEQMW